MAKGTQTVRVLELGTDGKARLREISNRSHSESYEDMAKIIGGGPTRMPVRLGPSLYMYVNDEGLIDGSEPNQLACDVFVKIIEARNLHLGALLAFSSGSAIGGNAIIARIEYRMGNEERRDLTESDLKLVCGPKAVEGEMPWTGFEIESAE